MQLLTHGRAACIACIACHGMSSAIVSLAAVFCRLLWHTEISKVGCLD